MRSTVTSQMNIGNFAFSQIFNELNSLGINCIQFQSTVVIQDRETRGIYIHTYMNIYDFAI